MLRPLFHAMDVHHQIHQLVVVAGPVPAFPEILRDLFRAEVDVREFLHQGAAHGVDLICGLGVGLQALDQITHVCGEAAVVVAVLVQGKTQLPLIQSQFLIFPLIPTLCGFSFSVCSANCSAEFEEKS